jgi:hypothetical protein
MSSTFPLPRLGGLTGSGAGDVWAVGDLGAIYHWNGSSWSDELGGMHRGILLDIWGDTTDTWTVGAEDRGGSYVGVALHRLAPVWVEAASWPIAETTYAGKPNAIWGTGPTSVWLVGNAGLIMRWDGSSWAEETSPTVEDLLGVWGMVGTDEVWAVGMDGVILHRESGVWTPESSGTLSILYAVWGSGSTDVWAVGDGGTTLHRDATDWSSVSSWTPNRLQSIHGTSSGDIWAVGAGGTIIHWNGSAWSNYSVTSITTGEFTGVWAGGAADAWAVGPTLVRWNGTTWSAADIPSGGGRSLWGSSPGNLRVVASEGTVLHRVP